MEIRLNEEENKVAESLREMGISDPLIIAFMMDRTILKPNVKEKMVVNLKSNKLVIKLDKKDKEFLNDLVEMNISIPVITALLFDMRMEEPDDKNVKSMKMFIPFENEEHKEKLLKAFGLEDEEVKQK